MKRYSRAIVIICAVSFECSTKLSWQDFTKSGLNIVGIQHFQTDQHSMQPNAVQDLSLSQSVINVAKPCLVISGAVLYLIVAAGINHLLLPHPHLFS